MERPILFADVDKLFTASLCAEVWAAKSRSKAKATGKAKGKGKEAESSKPSVKLSSFFTDAEIDEDYIVDTMRAFKKLLDAAKAASGSSVVVRPLRTDDSIPARVAAVSSCKWPVESGNASRDVAFFWKVGLLEQYMVEKFGYRQRLLPTALGAVRLSLCSLLDPCVEPHVISSLGQSRDVKSWLFIDHLVPPPSAKAGPVNLEDYLANHKDMAATAANVTWLKGLRNKVQNYPPAWAPGEEDDDPRERRLDFEVSDNLNRLVTSIYAVERRNAMRARTGNPLQKYIVADDLPPQDILPTRLTFEDEHTRHEYYVSSPRFLNPKPVVADLDARARRCQQVRKTRKIRRAPQPLHLQARRMASPVLARSRRWAAPLPRCRPAQQTNRRSGHRPCPTRHGHIRR